FGRGVEGEALVARRRLALGSRERVLLVGFGMEEHREVGAHGPEALRDHLLGRRAHDDVIAVLHREPEKLVAHRAADGVRLHAGGVDAYGSSSATISFSCSALSTHARTPLAERMAAQ